MFKLVVYMVDQRIDSGGGLELDFSKDGAFKCLWERLLDLGSTGELCYALAVMLPA